MMKVVIKMNRAEARVVIMTILYQIFLCQKNNMEYDIDEIINENKGISMLIFIVF